MAPITLKHSPVVSARSHAPSMKNSKVQNNTDLFRDVGIDRADLRGAVDETSQLRTCSDKFQMICRRCKSPLGIRKRMKFVLL